MVDIVYEDKSVIVCHKKAGMAVQTARPGEMDMVSALKNYLARDRKGEPYVGVIHRLDQPVEGLVVFAKDKKAAAVLSQQVQSGGTMHKEYLARVYGKLNKDCGRLTDWMIKDSGNISRIVSEGTAGAQKAELDYETLSVSQDTALLKIVLHSGRHHQIRLQLSSNAAPILGDTRYGTQESVAYARSIGIRRLCLIAKKLEFDHPVSAKRKSFELDVML